MKHSCTLLPSFSSQPTADQQGGHQPYQQECTATAQLLRMRQIMGSWLIHCTVFPNLRCFDLRKKQARDMSLLQQSHSELQCLHKPTLRLFLKKTKKKPPPQKKKPTKSGIGRGSQRSRCTRGREEGGERERERLSTPNRAN
jgi:hypothetical protein